MKRKTGVITLSCIIAAAAISLGYSYDRNRKETEQLKTARIEEIATWAIASPAMNFKRAHSYLFLRFAGGLIPGIRYSELFHSIGYECDDSVHNVYVKRSDRELSIDVRINRGSAQYELHAETGPDYKVSFIRRAFGEPELSMPNPEQMLDRISQDYWLGLVKRSKSECKNTMPFREKPVLVDSATG
jgi:hypothetical protein